MHAFSFTPCKKYTRHSFTRQVFALAVCLVTMLAAACTATPVTPIPTTAVPQPTAVPATPIPPTTTPQPTVAPLPTVAPMPTDSPDELIRVSAIPEVDSLFEAMVKDGKFAGSVLIAYKGKVLLNKGYGYADKATKTANTPQTRFRIPDITKEFTAMAVLILQTQGKLNVKDLMCKFIADCPAAWKDITIHQLLTHSSGMPDFSSIDYYLRKPPSTSAELIADIKDKPLTIQPGSGFKYSNTAYGILGAIIEKASGMKYSEFLQKSIFTPLKMLNTGEVTKTTPGMALGYQYTFSVTPYEYYDQFLVASDGLYSTVEDLYLWDQALYTEALLPKALLDEMFTVHVSLNKGVGAGYGWGRSLCGRKPTTVTYFHWSGIMPGFNVWSERKPDYKYTHIFLSNLEEWSEKDFEKIMETMIIGYGRYGPCFEP